MKALGKNKTAEKIVVALWLTSSDATCWTIDARQRRRLAAALPDAKIIHCRDSEAFKRALKRARVAVAWAFKQEWLEQAPLLEWIATPSAGRDFFSARREGLEITYGAFHGRIIAETVAAMLLAENRGLFPAARAQAAGEPWPRASISDGMRLLQGTHAAILGFGSIGLWIGRALKPFGIRLTGLRRKPRALPQPDYFTKGDRIVNIAKLDELLPDVDHLILALPGDTGADNIINSRRLALLKRGAALYNIGRGNLIDDQALVKSLSKGHLRAAYLDVFRQEPLADDSVLRGAPNLLVLPHASAIAPEYLDLFLDELVAHFHQRYGKHLSQ